MLPPEAPSPSSLIHLDLQQGNILFRYSKKPCKDPTNVPNESDIEIECRISNWKIASIGSPLHDVAFLLLSSVAPDVRRRYTSELIRFYYTIFEV